MKSMQNVLIVTTREHMAWEVLKKRIDYLNTFPGNRSEMVKFTKEVEDAWAKAGELELELDLKLMEVTE